MHTYYNDIKPFCCKVLRKQIALGNLPEGYVDERSITDIHATDLMGYQHAHLFAGIGAFPLGFLRAGVPLTRRILTGGFPCQDISIAGEQAGITGERSGLWKHMLRLIRESSELSNPFDYVVIENVRNLLSGGDYEEAQEAETQEGDRGSVCSTHTRNMDNVADEPVFRAWMGEVLRDVAESGYDAEWTVLRAADYGAPHLRERVFIVAYPQSTEQKRIWHSRSRWHGPSNIGTSLACSLNSRCENTRHIGSLALSRWQEPRRIEGTSRSRRSSESNLCTELADISCLRSNTRWTQPKQRRKANTNCISSSVELADASSQRCEECDVTTWHSEERQSSRCVSTHRERGQSESRVRRVFDGLPFRLDGYRWPARPGEVQHSWEPARVTTEKQSNRVARLEALGNAVVVAVAEAIGHAIRIDTLASVSDIEV